MADIDSPSSPGTGQDAAAPNDSSDFKNMPPTNDSDAENMPLSSASGSKNMTPSMTRNGRGHATRKDHGHHEAETEKTDEESDYEFADVSDPAEQCKLVINKMLNMDDEEFKEYKKRHPWPSEFPYPSVTSDDGK